MPQESLSNYIYYYIFQQVKQTFGSYRCKYDLNVGTVATRWLVTQVTNTYRSKQNLFR